MPPEPDGLPHPHRAWVMACILLGIILAGLDSAIANIALPTIAKDLHSTDAATVWVVNAYQLAAATLLLPAASLGERYGLKRIYGCGLAIFTAASLACALAPTLPILVAARLVQGIGGACMATSGGALIRAIYPRRLLASGFAAVALTVALSAALGPSIAAVILSVATWPWLFLVNVPLGLVAAPLFFRVCPPTPGRHHPLDLPGALLNTAAIGLTITGVDGLGHNNRTLALLELAAGLASTAALVAQQRRQERRGRHPLLPLDLLRIPLFALSMATSVCAYAAQILAYVSLPFLFQTVMGRSEVATGLLVTPWPLFVAAAAPFAGRLAARHPASILGSAGMATLCLGLLALTLMPTHPTDLDVTWRMAICGIGFGFYQTPNNLTLMTAGPAARSGAASGMVAVARYLGWSLGSALVALIFELRGAGAPWACIPVAAALAAAGALFSISRIGTAPARA